MTKPSSLTPRGEEPAPGRRTATPVVAQPGTRPVAVAGTPGEVRIIGGQWKRSKLKVIQRPGLRPTPDRVRETIFNWLGPDLTGCRVLDAFAGSGALGLEAASRGATEVWLLEQDAGAVRELQGAHARLRAGAGVRIVRADAMAWMARAAEQRFDLIFLDPPFDSGLALEAAARAAALLAPAGLLLVESRALVHVPILHLLPVKQLKAGAVHIQLLQRPLFSES